MSALPPKADMFSVEIDVCFVPIADIPKTLVGEGDRFERAAGAGMRQKRVRLPAGGFGYFLSVSLYFSTTASPGPAAHPKSAPT
jgi:hypothetical protein